jgi:hypothetical protein
MLAARFRSVGNVQPEQLLCPEVTQLSIAILYARHVDFYSNIVVSDIL